MRIPTRRGEKLKQQRDDQTAGLLYLTQAGVKKMQEQLKRLESEDLPQAIRDVRTTAEFGDFSENAEYQEAKARMRRLHSQIFGLKEKLKLVSIISRDRATDRVQLGSTVVLESGGEQKTYEIVGPQETNPARGRISHVSPLGVVLIGRTIGEAVHVQAGATETSFIIRNIS